MIGMDSTVPTHYSSFPLGELLDYWDLPLATEDRAALLAELQERGYRTDGLPEVQSVPKAQSVSKKQTTPVVPEGPTGWIAFSRIGLAFVWVLHKGAQQALANAAREDENTELDLDDEGALAE